MYSLSHLGSLKKSLLPHHPLFISLQSGLFSHCSAEISQWPLVTFSLYSLITVLFYFFLSYYLTSQQLWPSDFSVLLLLSFSFFFFSMTTYSLNFPLTSWILFLHLFSGSFYSGQLSSIQVSQGLASASSLLTLYLFSNLTDFRFKHLWLLMMPTFKLSARLPSLAADPWIQLSM